MIKKNKIVIIGGNAAGPAAAAKAKRVNPDASVKIFEAGEYISTGTCEMPYVISGDIDSHKDIVFFTPEKFKIEKGVDVFIKHQVKKINRKEKTITVHNIEENTFFDEPYDSLIIAAGSKTIKIKEIPHHAENVFCLKTIPDLKRIEHYIKKENCGRIAIFGSGYIGLEAADSFRKRGFEVTVVEKKKNPLPVSEPEIQFLIREILEEHKVNFIGGFKSLKAVEDNNRVTSINIDGRLLEFDFVLAAVGFEPNNELAKDAGLEIGKSGCLKVNKKLQTNDSNIYAAGDIIEYKNDVTYRSSQIPLATLAHASGHAAGENAAGGSAEMEPAVKNISVKIFDKYHVSIGISSFEADELQLSFSSVYDSYFNKIKVMPGSEKVYGKIIFEKDSHRLLGAEFLGGKETSGYADLLSALIKLRQPADVLEKINYNYTPPLSPHINLLSILGRKVNSERK